MDLFRLSAEGRDFELQGAAWLVATFALFLGAARSVLFFLLLASFNSLKLVPKVSSLMRSRDEGRKSGELGRGGEVIKLKGQPCQSINYHDVVNRF